LITRMGPVLEQNRTICPYSRRLLRTQKEKKDGSFCGVVFTRGKWYVDGTCMTFETVLDWKHASFNEHDVEKPHSVYESDSDDEDLVALCKRTSKEKPRALPRIESDGKDTWWLGKFLLGDDWKEWYLVNFEKEKIFVGPKGLEVPWPRKLDLNAISRMDLQRLEAKWYRE
jgi:hypothetical protein